MRKKLPNVYDVRTRRGFLLFSKKINNEKRWLEYAEWEQIFKTFGYYSSGWFDTKWIN